MFGQEASTQLVSGHIRKIGVSVKKLCSLDYFVGIALGYFLNWWLIWNYQPTMGSAFLRQVGLGYKKLVEISTWRDL